MTFRSLLVEDHGAVRVLTLNRPDKRNAITVRLATELDRALRDANADDAVRVIVLTGAAIFLFSMFLAPRRGIIGRAASEIWFRRKTARENLLRTIYELGEADADQRPRVATSAIAECRAWRPNVLHRMLRGAARRNELEYDKQSARLTEAGLKEATRLTRIHRLWELFLIEGANIAADAPPAATLFALDVFCRTFDDVLITVVIVAIIVVTIIIVAVKVVVVVEVCGGRRCACRGRGCGGRGRSGLGRALG